MILVAIVIYVLVSYWAMVKSDEGMRRRGKWVESRPFLCSEVDTIMAV